MTEQLEQLKNKIVEDYKTFLSPSPEKVKEFSNKISWKIGKKYVKVLTETSVWGFIVNCDDDKQFNRGDILKAANFNTPARNQARGNIFGEYRINWTGPRYLK